MTKESKYKLTFTLKQHTPMIHFQGDQYGATLRATELKPKLDRFLLERLHKEGVELTKEKQNGDVIQNSDYKNWFSDPQHLALNYRMKISAPESAKRERDVVVMPPTIEKTVLSNEITIDIITQVPDLKSKLMEYYPAFFALHNFGKRQGKGFGCFYPESGSKEQFEAILKGRCSYKLSNPLRNSDHLDNAFYLKLISPKWGALKSGINKFWGDNPEYRKSSVFRHLDDKELRWDKRWIKLQLLSLIQTGQLEHNLSQRRHDPIDINDVNSWEDSSDEEYRFGRALLGLAEHYEYQTVNSKVKYKVIVDGGEVARFQSPLVFKVFDKSVYAFLKEEAQDIHGKPFKFRVQKKTRRGNDWSDDGRSIEFQEPLNAPKKEEFDLKEFFNKYMPSLGFNKLV